MFNDEDIKKIKEIIKEETNKIELFNYVNDEVDKQELKEEIRKAHSDINDYDKDLRLHSIEFRLKLIEKVIFGIEKANKLVIKLILALFVISMILLISFIILNFML